MDGIAATEIALIEDIVSMANMDAGAARRIVDMPFLETIEPPDKSAIASLRLLAAFRPEVFVNVMSNTALRDGIADDEAPIVATRMVSQKQIPVLIDVLLDDSNVFLELRSITLPLAGEVVLSIIRTGPGEAKSMDLLEHSVRGVEEFMGLPLPTTMLACSMKTPSTVPTQEQISVLTSPSSPSTTSRTEVMRRVQPLRHRS